MRTSGQIVDSFVMRHLESASIAEQIEVSQAMAEFASSPAEKKRWLGHAEELKAVHTDVQQLWFKFRRASS